MSRPTIGRIVMYATTAHDQRIIKEHPECTNQEKLPAIIVAVNADDTVNLHVLCDGPKRYYAKEIKEGKEPGQYSWPEVPKADRIIDKTGEHGKHDPVGPKGELGPAGFQKETGIQNPATMESKEVKA